MIFNTPELFGTPKHTVMDPIHGSIPIFSHERDIIDHPLFQRLRHIKQNDILFYVFPSATHSRFEHCIGTMHVATRIFKSMMRNYFAYRTIKDLNSYEIESIKYILGCLRIAALLHDLGHMPFSHQFESSDVGKDILSDKTFINEFWNENMISYLNSKPKKLNHEYFSLACAIEILEKVKKEKNLEFPFKLEDILGIMEYGDAKPSEKFKKHSASILSLFIEKARILKIFYSEEKISIKLQSLFKDIISGEIDADKMDYLLRDSYFSGASYGNYNIDHLIKNLYVGWEITTNMKNTWVGIAIHEKGKGAFEDFVHSRFRMYLQIYNHKCVVNFKWLIKQAVFEVSKIKENKELIERSISNLDKFSDFTDTYFWELFRKHARNYPDSACYYVINREKIRYIKSLPIDDKPGFKIDGIEKEIEKEAKCELISNEASARFSKITPDFDKIRLLVYDRINRKPELDAISSDFFENIKDVNIRHYFEKPSFTK